MPFPCPKCKTNTRAFDNRHVKAHRMPKWFPAPATYRERFCESCGWHSKTIEITVGDMKGIPKRIADWVVGEKK